MGVTYQQSARMRKVQPMNKDEILNYYRSNGEQLPDRFSDTETARRIEITKHYRPYEVSEG